MFINIETTKNRRRLKLVVNRVYQGVFGMQRILERVALLMASLQTDDPEDLPRSYTLATDALEYAASAVERLNSSDEIQQQLLQRLADPKAMEEDYQALLAEVRQDPEMQHAWHHASSAFGAVRSCLTKASVLGTIAAGLAAAYSLLDAEMDGEELRSLYEEAEPLVTLLLSVQRDFDTSATTRISAPGGDA